MRFLALSMTLCLAVCLGAAADAKRAIHPKAGGYAGKVTNANGKGKVHISVATFNFRDGHGDQKGPQLFKWTGILKCDDGSSSDVGPSVFAPLEGARFKGKAKAEGQTVTLVGRFTSNTKLHGTARVKSKGCDTGPVKFKAKRKS